MGAVSIVKMILEVLKFVFIILYVKNWGERS